MIWWWLACAGPAQDSAPVPSLPELEDCSDGIDNDLDGDVDCRDWECRDPRRCPEDCTDGWDNDGDGLTDCQDRDCMNPESCPEDCEDGLDNDGDWLVDRADPDCWTAEDCWDGVDNDGDGARDCADTDCAELPECIEDCSDGSDNDADGAVDCLDTDCWQEPVCIEDCFDGVDNNGNGQVDCEDWGCTEVCTETSCVDGIDNDLDGYIDCEDEACWGLGPCPLSTRLQVLGAQSAWTKQSDKHAFGGPHRQWSTWVLTGVEGRAQVEMASGTLSCDWQIGTLSRQAFYTSSGQGNSMSALDVQSTGACLGAVDTADFAYSSGSIPFLPLSNPWQVSGTDWVQFTTLSASTHYYWTAWSNSYVQERTLTLTPGGWWTKARP